VIKADTLSRVYEGSQNVSALAGVSFTVGRGERASIVGRSGSGKTTLLNLLAGLDTPTSGRLVVNDLDVGGMRRRELADYRLKSIGIIFQSFQLLPQRTAAQNVEVPLILSGEAPGIRRSKAVAALESVGLGARSGHFPWQMSGGEQQRVAIARALIHEPPILLADEPTGNLDSRTANEIVHVIRKLCEERGVTLGLVTHDQSLADSLCERQFVMADGRLAEAELAHDMA